MNEENRTETLPRTHAEIKGWGVDANADNDPTYPLKKHTPTEHEGYNWKRPSQQKQTVEVLHSNERPNLSAAYGEAMPPSGLSGMIRRYAFRHSESSYLHWLPLMMADRINVVEGRVTDLLHGRVPNPFSERGWAVEWKHNRPALVRKMVIRAAIVGGAIGVVALLMNRRERRPVSRMGRIRKHAMALW